MLDILFLEFMSIINKTWPFFHAGFSYDFPSTVLLEEKERHPELAVGRMGRKGGSDMAGIKLRTLVSFSEDLENIKEAGVAVPHTLRLRYVRKLSILCTNTAQLLY